jgi:hypothetical protein
VPTALFYDSLDLRRQLVLRRLRVSLLETLIVLKADHHGGWPAVVSEDGLGTGVAGATDQLGEVVTGVTDRHLGS